MTQKRKQYKSEYLRFVSSYGAKATLELSLTRTTRNGKTEYLPMEVEIGRADIHCIYKAIKAFADKEREQVAGLPL